MFYLLTSNKSERNNNIYPVGCELIKKVDLILNGQNSEIKVSNSNIIQSNVEMDIYENQNKN